MAFVFFLGSIQVITFPIPWKKKTSGANSKLMEFSKSAQGDQNFRETKASAEVEISN